MKSIIALLFLSSLLAAQNIIVKYRPTPVDIDKNNFICKSADSSLVVKSCYDKEFRYMVINLQGTWYHYCGMPYSTWVEFNDANSLGRYYRKYIRGEFDCRVGFVPEY